MDSLRPWDELAQGDGPSFRSNPWPEGSSMHRVTPVVVALVVSVTGRWDHGYLKQDRSAIRATSVERVPSP